MNRIVIYCYKIFFVLLCCVAVPSLLTARNVNASGTVVAFGDSITAGWPYQTYDGNGCYYCGGFEPSLQTLFDWYGPGSSVYNYGVPGEMTGDGYNRLDWVMASTSPDYVLLMEGTNDLTFFVDPGTVAWMVYAMSWKVRWWGGIPIIATITPDTRYGQDWKNVWAANAYINNYVANDPGVCLSDQSTALQPFWNYGYTYDGLHPNYWGYWIMAQTWYADITNLKQCSY